MEEKKKEKIGEWILFIAYLAAIFAFYYFFLGGFFEKSIMGLLCRWGLL